MTNLMETIGPVGTEPDAPLEPPNKRPRTDAEPLPEKSPSAGSPAAFSQLVFRPWESLAWNHKELFQKLKLTESPCDPADGSLSQEVMRLEERLNWLRMQNQKRYEKYMRGEDASHVNEREFNKALNQVEHLTESLQSHSQKISESMNIPLSAPDLVLPAGVMMAPAMHI
eukprot:Protomagalhaensia_wolfi_Nauph_80__4354@NODE_444_length_2514_cov_7_482828_g334_i0_p2_GENE_NODE_444_length_2514_cov_7_482828_g334_i0NODE_444_length_2514_cov_7_482828_g334_i0_p2_ORF_typecomplete_len170_score24_48TMCO5/PF14992_6/0_0035CHD5/PF04420_14/0_039YlqD/PF11068_8/0_086DUF5595/PF18077_1/9_1e03DUF5595/PF18077_1/1_7e03DUF5595/PF18077_1/0_21_NODE_444_length_2514_cov_7_482828_g334_i04951004